MKKLNKELQESNLFQELEIFENDSINKSIDAIYQLLEENFGSIGNKVNVCGSVAKIMDGLLPDNYEPKDVDLLIVDPFFWRFLQRNVEKIPARIKYKENRIILYTDSICIELWENDIAEKVNRKFGIYKNKINYSYVRYGD